MEQSSSKRFKFNKPESRGSVKSGRDSARTKKKVKKLDKITPKDKFTTFLTHGDSKSPKKEQKAPISTETMGLDKSGSDHLRRKEKIKKGKDKSSYLTHDPESLKKEQKAHLATKEQVKHLKTKVTCLNSDIGELENQLAEMEERVAKVKEEGANKIQIMKQFMVKKQLEIENLKAAYPDPVQDDMLGSCKSKISNKEAAVQTEDRAESSAVVTKEDIHADMKMEEGELPPTPEKMDKKANVKLVEDLSGLVEEVLKENKSLLLVIDTLDTKSKLRKVSQKVMVKEYDKLKGETRDLQTKVLRLTIENMKLKKENHKAKGVSLPDGS